MTDAQSPEASAHPGSGGPPGGAPSSPVAEGVRLAALCLLALVLLYRPIASGLTPSLTASVAFGLLLITALVLWAASELLGGRLRVRLGWPAAMFAAFMAAALASCVLAENWFAGLKWWWLFATYGLTAFLVLQLATARPERRLLLSCLFATAAALAVYAIWHRVLYVPALRRWFEQDPAYVQTVAGATGAMATDLAARLGSDRAYGSFLTANQLADFLVLTIFPLAALAFAAWRPARGGRRAAGVFLGILVALMLVTLCLTRSKGGWIAFLSGLVILGVATRGAFLCRRRGALAAVLAVVTVAVLAGLLAGALPGRERFARSLGVRAGYWSASVEMVRRKPLLGVGPGSWPEWYAMVKEPEFEESRSAHNFYLQLWAETGTAGLMLWLAAWAVGFAALRWRREAAPAGDDKPAPRRAGPDAAFWPAAAAVLMAGAALAFDYTMLGTLLPPRHVPDWLQGLPWLPYALMFAVWASAFVAVFALNGGAGETFTWGAVAGLGAFLVHSAGELTMGVPAIGGTVAALVGFVLADTALRRRQFRPGAAGGAVIVLLCSGVLVFWAEFVTPRVLRAAARREAAVDLRNELVAASQILPGVHRTREFAAGAARVTDELAQACGALPWDDGAWRELGTWMLWLAEGGVGGVGPVEATRPLERAIRLNPLSSPHWMLLGRANALAGNHAGAALAFRRAAERHPALPVAWYRYASALETATAAREDVSGVYAFALEMMRRQYHDRNRVLGPPAELAAAWAEVSGAGGPQTLLEVAEQLAARAGAAEVSPDATDAQVVARLTAGLKGGAELAQHWDACDDAAQERELWRVLGGRLWEWLLEVKIRQTQRSDEVLSPQTT